MKATFAFFAASILTVSMASAQADLFLVAVGFALTASDDTKVKLIDRTNCVFQVGKDVYRLNNVDIDRIKFESFVIAGGMSDGEHITRVYLHGKATVYEFFDKPLAFYYLEHASESEKPGIERLLKQEYPDYYKPQHNLSNEHTLYLKTNEGERVQRAWSYIYQHGCSGTKSPF
jgi:hypothetical protein